MKTQKFHQGDVQGRTIDSLPKNLKKIEKTPLALGEKSGHQHIVTGDYEMFEDEEKTVYVSVGSGGAILQHIHESNFVGYDSKEVMPVADHNEIVLTPDSDYVFGIHKKYNPFSKIWEKVAD